MAESSVKNIVLIAMDGSEPSNHAFEWYSQNIYRTGHYVILLHISVPGKKDVAGDKHTLKTLGASSEGGSKQAVVVETDQRETKFLDMLSTKLNEKGIGGKAKSVTGKPGEAICQVAKDEKVSFIVSGTRGRGVIKRALSGSVSDYILHNARVPVIIVPVKKEK